MDQDADTSHSEDALSLTDNLDLASVEEYNDVAAKQRASVLWLLSKAYMPKIPSELYDPCYTDHEGCERLKPQIVHALANAELYCLALANIYADPNYHNLNHHGVLQVLMRKGIDVVEPSDAALTETVLVQTAPIRMSAHMAVIEGIMALFVKEVLIPEKVMEVVSRYAVVNPENELPYDSEEAALLWINKSCIKLRHRIEEEIGSFHSPEDPDSSPRLHPPVIALAQDIGDLSDGCCLAALLSLYCPKYFRWQDIRLNDPMSLADSVHNLQLVQRFCQDNLPQDIYCLTLEDMVYLHPSILPNVLTFVADLMYIFEIRPPKHIIRPGMREDSRIYEEYSYVNQNGEKYPTRQKYRDPIKDGRSASYEMLDDTGRSSPQSNGSNGHRPLSARRSFGHDEKKNDTSHALRHVQSMNFSDLHHQMDIGDEPSRTSSSHHQSAPHEDDEEIAEYFTSRYHSPGQSNLLDQENNRRKKQQQQHSSEDVNSLTHTHYQVFHASKERSDKNNRKGFDDSDSKPGIKKSPSSYEIHQLSPSKGGPGANGGGYPRQRSQSELDIPQVKKLGSSVNISRPIAEDAFYEQDEGHAQEKTPAGRRSTIDRKNRNSFHEMPRYSSHKESDRQGKPAVPRRNNSDFFLHEGRDIETRINRLSGGQTYKKPKDLFARTEFNEENDSLENSGKRNAQENDHENTLSFAKLSKQRNDSGSAINVNYMQHDRDHAGGGTYKKATRPGYLHISPSQHSIPDISPTSGSKVNAWFQENSKQDQHDVDSTVASQMLDIRLKLEEKRKKIEEEKLRLEAMTKKQREKMGKAAFLQAVRNTSSGGQGHRNFSIEDLTEDLDSVRRKWLEQKAEYADEYGTENRDTESPSEDFQSSIEQLNCNLNDLQSDINRLTQQQEMIQKMLRSSNQTPTHAESYYLHDAPQQQKQQQQPRDIPRWAEPVQHPNQAYLQQMERPPQEVPHVGRGQWGQPVIPFSNLQPNHHLQNTPTWQQSSPMYQNRPSSVEPQMMSGQPMQHQMYEPSVNAYPFHGGGGGGGMHQGFMLHPQQQQQQSNYGMQAQPNYPTDQQRGFYVNQYPYAQQQQQQQQQPPYSMMQGGYNISTPGSQGQMPYQSGFHLHRSPSQTDAIQIPRSQSRTDMNYHALESQAVYTDDFGRPLKSTALQSSPPGRPVLGKTFRVPKPKLTSPSSPIPAQSMSHAQEAREEEAEESPPKHRSPSPPPAPPTGAASAAMDKGFYISFDDDQPKKPRPKLKPKHLKARSLQKKADANSKQDEADGGEDGSIHNQNKTSDQSSVPKNSWKQTFTKKQSDFAAGDLKESTRNSCEDKENISGDTSEDSGQNQSVPKAPGVGFVIGTAAVESDPDKELEMTRRKEMIMMMSLRRRAEQEAKRNQKQQEYLKKKEEERMKAEQAERKKEEEKLRRQLILEQYRQRKAAEEDDGPPGGRDEHRPSGKSGASVARPKSRSTSVTRSKPKGGQTSAGRGHDLSSPSSLDSPVGRGSQYNLSGGYHDDVSSEHSYTPSPRRSQNYPHSSPISPSSYPSSPGPLLPGMLGGNRSRGTPSDGLSDTSSTISSAWASEYTGPKLFVKPTTKSNRGIITNAVNTVLAGAVNAETKRKVLEEIDRSDGKHFLILFRDAGCQFRALYSYNPETEDVIKLYGVGPRVITNKMMDRFYKYNSGGKSFTQIHTKHLTATIDAFTIQNSLWQSKKVTPFKRDYL